MASIKSPSSMWRRWNGLLCPDLIVDRRSLPILWGGLENKKNLEPNTATLTINDGWKTDWITIGDLETTIRKLKINDGLGFLVIIIKRFAIWDNWTWSVNSRFRCLVSQSLGPLRKDFLHLSNVVVCTSHFWTLI